MYTLKMEQTLNLISITLRNAVTIPSTLWGATWPWTEQWEWWALLALHLSQQAQQQDTIQCGAGQEQS